MSERNYVVDTLKGLGIIFVVGGHSVSPFAGYYYTFHMGLFFFLSGFLMAESNSSMDFKGYLQKKIVKILLPYFIFFLISFVVCEWRTYKDIGSFFPVQVVHVKALITGGVSC